MDGTFHFLRESLIHKLVLGHRADPSKSLADDLRLVVIFRPRQVLEFDCCVRKGRLEAPFEFTWLNHLRVMADAGQPVNSAERNTEAPRSALELKCPFTFLGRTSPRAEEGSAKPQRHSRRSPYRINRSRAVDLSR